MSKFNLKKLTLSLLIPLSAGFIGSIFTAPALREWYVNLAKPEFNPPNYVFGPVWTALFLLMGISLYLVWSHKKDGRRDFALFVFAIQLGLNILWSVLFFYFQNPQIALVELVILWLAIAWTITKFIRISRLAGYLMIPYLLWVSFAFLLNFEIVRLNFY